MEIPEPPRIGFIGFGEAASIMAKGFLDAGAQPITACDVRDRPAVDGVNQVDGVAGVAAATDIIFAAVTSSTALPVAYDAAPFLEPRHVYLDINSTSPMVKQQIADVINGAGAQFIEAAVMSGVPGRGQTVPMLLVGAAAENVIKALRPYQVNMRHFGTEYGRATATKMFRSVLVKGMEALFQECLLGAETYGVSDEVFKSMDEGYPGADWQKMAHFLVGRTAIHGERRAHELVEAADTLRALGYEPFMCDAGAKRLAWLNQFGLKDIYGDDAPERFESVFEVVRKARKGG